MSSISRDKKKVTPDIEIITIYIFIKNGKVKLQNEIRWQLFSAHIGNNLKYYNKRIQTLRIHFVGKLRISHVREEEDKESIKKRTVNLEPCRANDSLLFKNCIIVIVAKRGQICVIQTYMIYIGCLSPQFWLPRKFVMKHSIFEDIGNN